MAAASGTEHQAAAELCQAREAEHEESALLQTRYPLASTMPSSQEKEETIRQLEEYCRIAKDNISWSGEGVVRGRLLFVGVPSDPHYFPRRQALRKAWFSDLQRPSLRGCVRARFIIGHSAIGNPWRKVWGDVASQRDQAVEAQLADEEQRFGDVTRVPLPDFYTSLPDKILHLLDIATDAGYAFVLKVDDDRVLRLDNLLRYIKGRSPANLLYAGRFFKKETTSLQAGVQGEFAKYAQGHGYLLSSALARRILRDRRTLGYVAYGSSSEDVDVGHWVKHVAEQSDTEYLSAWFENTSVV